MAEWTRTDAGYLLRTTHLSDGTGLNTPYRLYSGTVSDDGSAADRLFGGVDLDWFLTSVAGVIADPQDGEVNTVL